jgi:hypothetical protein
MDNSRYRLRGALVALTVVAISAVCMYIGGDHRAAWMTAAEIVVLGCLVYSSWRRSSDTSVPRQ